MIRIVAILLLVVGLGALIVYSQLRPEPDRVSGYIEADEIRLGSRVGGRVASVSAEEGQAVTEGMVLVTLEPYDLLEREREAALTLASREAAYQRMKKGLRPEEVAQAKARLDQLQATLDQLETGPREQEIKTANARLQAARAELKLAEQLYERHSMLAKTDAISDDELDHTRQKLASAAAMLTVRQNELELLEIGTREEEKRAGRAAVEEAKEAWQMSARGFREEEIQQAEADRDAAKAALEAIRRQKEELAIKSPLNGTVDSLDLQPGDMVAPGAPVMSIIDHRRLWVRAFVPQNRVGLQIGRKLRVTVDSLPDQEFVGTVSFIARQAEFTPSNVQTPKEREKQVFRIKVTLDDHLGKLRPGMTADVWLDSIGESP